VILAIVGAVVLVCGGGVVLWLVGKEAGAKAMCKANLEQQLAPQIRNETAGGKVDPELDRLRGEKFWKEIARRRGQPDQFICFGAALKGEQRGLLGPQKPLSEIRDDEPVGCCPRGTHKEGIWIIYKTGKIEFVDSDSPAAKKAFEALGD